MFRLLTSVKTQIGLFAMALVFFLAGSLIIPGRMEEFSGINDALLLGWLSEARPSASWWIYGLITILGVIALSTVACILDALRGTVSFKALPAPIIHTGMLFVLLGHLLTASVSLRLEYTLGPGDSAYSSGAAEDFRVDEIIVRPDAVIETYREVRGQWLKGGAAVKPMLIKPGAPASYHGTWLFIKSADLLPSPKATLRAQRDPGAPFALAGGGIFALGCILLLFQGRAGRMVS